MGSSASAPAPITSILVRALIFSLGFMQPTIALIGFDSVPTDFLFVAAALAWAWALGRGRTEFVWDNAYWLLAVYLAASIASAAAADEPAASAPALVKQLYLLSLPILIVNLVRTADELRAAIRWWLAGTAVVALVAVASLAAFLADPQSPLLQYTRFHFGTLPPGDYPRLRLTFLNANMACNYLTVSVMLLLVARRIGWVGRPLFHWLLAGIALAALLTISPGLGGFLLAIGTWIWLSERERRPRLAKVAMVGGLLAGMAFVVAMAVTPIAHPTAPFLINLPLIGVDLAPSARLMIWLDAARNFLADPLLGRGIGADAALVRYQSPSGQLQVQTDAHNAFLNVAVQTGLVGLASLIAILVYAGRLLRPSGDRRIALSGLAAAFVVAFAYDGLGGSFEDARHLWVLFGLLIVTQRTAGVDDSARSSDGPVASRG